MCAVMPSRTNTEPLSPGPASSRPPGTTRTAQKSARVPPHVTMPLLESVSANSMDPDYRHVAERNGGASQARQIRRGVAALVTLVLFGLLVTTAAVQTARNAEAKSSVHESLVTQVKATGVQVDAVANASPTSAPRWSHCGRCSCTPHTSVVPFPSGWIG